jgi:cytochrome c oxidase assembly protein subunit 15
VSGQHVHRLTFEGRDTLTWIVHRHATIAALFGVAVIAVWFLHRRKEIRDTLEPLTVLGVLLAAQGLVGSVQYELRLPADMVWVHVGLATATWIALLWVTAAAGTLAPRTRPLVSPVAEESLSDRPGAPAEEPALIPQ